jgi:DNA-binding HxlR family transcriptional regulator
VDWSDTPAEEVAHNPLRLLQEKWVLRLVYALLKLGSSGYNELGRRVGINVATLGQRLRAMEEAGLINRTVVRQKPMQYAYTLTASGTALQTILRAMEQWASREPIAR